MGAVLATAVELSESGMLDGLMTYDMQLARGARDHGITVLTPRTGAEDA